MKKSILLFSILLSSVFIQSAQAIPEKKFKTCTALNKVYPGGVAEKSTSVNKNKAGVLQKSKKVPKVSSKVYKENKGLDRDKDGIACEN
jgi:hypothetical protein